MSLEYVERKIVEALKLHNGHALRTRQQITAWALEDPKLLMALTKSHLTGIVAYNVERVLSGRAAAARKNQQATQKIPQKTVQNVPKTKGAFGAEILKAVTSSSSEIFGLEHMGDIKRPGGVSQKHIDAIRAIAKNKKF